MPPITDLKIMSTVQRFLHLKRSGKCHRERTQSKGHSTYCMAPYNRNSLETWPNFNNNGLIILNINNLLIRSTLVDFGKKNWFIAHHLNWSRYNPTYDIQRYFWRFDPTRVFLGIQTNPWTFLRFITTFPSSFKKSWYNQQRKLHTVSEDIIKPKCHTLRCAF